MGKENYQVHFCFKKAIRKSGGLRFLPDLGVIKIEARRPIPTMTSIIFQSSHPVIQSCLC
jgi:hypothetical protein